MYNIQAYIICITHYLSDIIKVIEFYKFIVTIEEIHICVCYI